MSRSRPNIQTSLAMLPNNSSLLLAVSGGLDSVVLLDAISKISKTKKLRLEIAHVDHALRETSLRDQRHVESLANQYKIAFHSLRLLPPEAGINLEAWGREQRYAFFTKVSIEKSLDWIVTAHQADDVAETLLMRLISNKEPHSIYKVDPVRRLLRPLLQVSRSEIEAYAEKNKLIWFEDETNADTQLLRNRVRKIIMPVLRQNFDPEITEILSKRAVALAQDLDFLDRLALSAVSSLNTIKFESKDWLSSFRKLLALTDSSQHWRLAALALQPQLGYLLGRDQAEKVCQVLNGTRVAVELTGSWTLRRSASSLTLAKLLKN